ncbi:UDP-glucose/GDP-mannose dehydrogenase family protein [Bacillus sp. 31A1R]|uniref:UDP-glucose 6-dehydrogenase n=1 Tax=Robertmurraya mangrovi TaxID=3098077 RepID=A0ABU5J2R6_9BACI|nr:UDP-glucose/GDP-mannose dehydrogenase family protein [Bacillus sp. 31A1R]MDZ5473694.1 UDP-glucose/GDP-mannose dehydrogenase family protein [Bacillus sp. 31A1R]
MNICVIGAGYVGLTTAAVLAKLGHQVYCVDINEERIEKLQRCEVPIYEPGLQELLEDYKARLIFSTDVAGHISQSEVILIAVGTPSLPDGRTNLSFIYSVVDTISQSITSYKTIITKSTVPPGTNESIHHYLLEKGVSPHLFDVVSNPEFLREGSAIYDMENPDRLVVGIKPTDKKSRKIMEKLYVGLNSPMIVTSLNGAEMIKYASNAFLATKISFINEIAMICDQYDVNIEDVSKGIGTDSRIGPHFLKAGIGYGGSCFPKDVKSLIQSALSKNVCPKILSTVEEVNGSLVDLYMKKLLKEMKDLSGRRIAVLGVSFKPNTDDIRESPAVKLIEKLSQQPCMVTVYDPKAKLPDWKKDNISIVESVEKAVLNSDCIIVATDWDEFVKMDLEKMRTLSRGKILLDARNCLNPKKVSQSGFRYIGVART